MAKEKNELSNQERIWIILQRWCQGIGGAKEFKTLINQELPLNESTGEYAAEIDLSEIEKSPSQYTIEADALTIMAKKSGRKIKVLLDELYDWTADQATGNASGKKIIDAEFNGRCQYCGAWYAQKGGRRYDTFKISIKLNAQAMNNVVTGIEPAWDAA